MDGCSSSMHMMHNWPQGSDIGTFKWKNTPPKTNMTMDNQPVEDVSPIKNCGFSSVIVFLGGFWNLNRELIWTIIGSLRQKSTWKGKKMFKSNFHLPRRCKSLAIAKVRELGHYPSMPQKYHPLWLSVGCTACCGPWPKSCTFPEVFRASFIRYCFWGEGNKLHLSTCEKIRPSVCVHLI